MLKINKANDGELRAFLCYKRKLLKNNLLVFYLSAITMLHYW